MEADIHLRELDAGDGPAVAELSAQSSDSGAVAFRSAYRIDPVAALRALRPQMTGVVATVPGRDGIVGMGMMETGECRAGATLVPFAYLYSLAVHPDFRRRGIAGALARRRIETAWGRLGPDCLIFAGVQKGNEGSLRNAAKWSTQKMENRTRVVAVGMRSRPPHAPAGLTVRLVAPVNIEPYTAAQERFYADFNLYPPLTAAALGKWLDEQPLGLALHGAFAAADAGGNLLAGARVVHNYLVETMQVVGMPGPLRFANSFLHLVPADGHVNRVSVHGLWFAPGREDAAAHLWESLRWLYRAEASTLMTFIDSAGPLARVVRQPWYVPRSSGTVVFAGPQALDEAKPLYLHM